MSSPSSQRGFTLVELMISVALVLVLILGINEVFRLTSDTIGAGQALSNSLRDQRAARTVLEDDFANAAPDSPVFIITNQAVSAFRDRADEQSALDPADPTRIDRNRDNAYTAGTDDVSPANPGQRVHRIDTVTFFTRKPVRRQGGNYLQNTATGDLEGFDLVGSTASAEAFVSYGHLRLPDNAATEWFDPAQPDLVVGGITRRNDNNRYAVQFMLGRRATVLSPFVGGGESVWQAAIASGAPLNLSPLSMATGTRASTTGVDVTGGRLVVASSAGGTTVANTRAGSSPGQPWSNPRVWDGRVDLAQTSISDFARILGDYTRDVTFSGTSYNTQLNSGRWFLPASPMNFGGSDHQYQRETRPNQTTAPQTLVYRTEADPYGSRTFSASNNRLVDTLGRTSSVFLPRCTQFIVEYAGDFITQDNRVLIGAAANSDYGRATAVAPDGEIDYVVHNGQRRIRWYGMPRYTNSGDATASGTYTGPVVRGTAPTSAGVTNTNLIPDVVPLSDVIYAINGSTGNRATTDLAPHERVVMTSSTVTDTANNASAGRAFHAVNSLLAPGVTNDPVDPDTFLRPSANYASTDPATTNRLTFPSANYVAAWQGGGPRMIRITLALEDPNRPNDAPQTYEYVFTLPY